MNKETLDLLVVGGGAAGFFCAINYAEKNPGKKILILEAGTEPLSKVRISGGGRCNLTHACWDPAELISNYPRGLKELLGPFHKFGPGDTVQWFEDRGVPLKVEEDGRMFPASNRSQSIVDCFMKQLAVQSISLKTRCRALAFSWDEQSQLWTIQTEKQTFVSRQLFLAAGSDNRTWQFLKENGHTIIDPVPSLFSFNLKDEELKKLMGLSVRSASLEVPECGLTAEGPMLITHWGLSGPAVLRLSAWGARILFDRNYQFKLVINWTNQSPDEVQASLNAYKNAHGDRFVQRHPLFDIPSRLWAYLLMRCRISAEMKWSGIQRTQMEQLTQMLCRQTLEVNGKTRFKEEFVTAGGVALDEVDMRRFKSRKLPHLYFAGEILDIDAITGGFNFQAAWTGAWLAAMDMNG
ncbi:MAG TPA: NAD(P)/FAD-dependent oxidoreductase [Bacteroidales bacterium]|nr:NAD(P)/FAD-dependent oxidoreductase [Bacteroidales bacterium]